MKQLIELAESKGYVNRFFVYSGSQIETDYISLCLLKHWLINYKNISVDVCSFKDKTGFTCYLDDDFYGEYESENKALKEGIKKALELI